MSVLAIDIGNSRVGLGVFTQGKSVDPAQRFPHLDLAHELAPALKTLWETAQGETRDHEDPDADSDTGIVIASVVPAVTAQVQEVIKQTLHLNPRLIGRGPHDIHVPLKTKLRDETTVGQDRLLAALAAFINTE